MTGAWRQGRTLGVRSWGLSRDGDVAEGEDREGLREERAMVAAIRRGE